MKKLAIFVEGQTEKLFAERLLIEIAGASDIFFERKKIVGNILVTEGQSKPKKSHKYFVLLVDCSGDTRVNSEIRDQYESLTKQNFEMIIGIRDVFPIPRGDISKLQKKLYYKMKTKPITPVIILSVMEIEAWFLAEHTHFERIKSTLKISKIKSSLGFDPEKDDMQLRDHPSKDLDDAYKIGGCRYTKRKPNCLRTIDKLDYENIYIELINKLSPLKELVVNLNKFLEYN